VLLKKVVPYYCLVSIWSQWDMKYKNYLAPSIHTTINQFDTMVSSVITTSLGDQSMKDSDQAWWNTGLRWPGYSARGLAKKATTIRSAQSLMSLQKIKNL
jgi:hypothetical protein